MKKLLLLLITAAFFAACGGNPSELTQFEPPAEPPVQGETPDLGAEAQPASIQITFDYEKQSGWASNQFAVWLEDMDGNYVRTLYATRWTANGGYSSRPTSIPVWVTRSGAAEADKAAIDAISGATPGTGEVSTGFTFIADELPPGEYRFFVEGTLRWSNQVLFTGVIDTNGGAVTVEADVEYFYIECDNHNALTAESAENSMIRNVVARFTP
jgi:hypothetical protein